MPPAAFLHPENAPKLFPHWGSLQRSPDPLAGLRGPTFKGRGGRGEGEGRDFGH